MATDGKGFWSNRILVYGLLPLLGLLVLLLVIPSFSRSRESARHSSGYVPGVGVIDPDTGAPAQPYDAYKGKAVGARGAAGGGMRGGGAVGGPASAEYAPESRSDEASGFEARPAAYAPERVSPMLIRTGDLRLRVEDVTEAHEEVGRIAREAGGYVADTNLSSEEGPTYAVITLRLPSEGLDSVIGRISALGKVISKKINTQEVTQEYVDLSSRKRNLEREEERLLELLQRAGKISDLLQVEQFLARVRGEIETITGRMRYLENRVSLSTLTVHLGGPEPKPSTGGPVWTATDVYRQAGRSLKDTGQTLATIGIWLGVYVPVWLPLLLVLVWLARRAIPRPESTTVSGR